MAKALVGFMPGDRSNSRIVAENTVLRQRVADLEETLVRLRAENDALAAQVPPHPEDVLEPA